MVVMMNVDDTNEYLHHSPPHHVNLEIDFDHLMWLLLQQALLVYTIYRK
jgi:hypothetical protein